MNTIDIERTTSFGVEIEGYEVYLDAKFKGTFKAGLDLLYTLLILKAFI